MRIAKTRVMMRDPAIGIPTGFFRRAYTVNLHV